MWSRSFMDLTLDAEIGFVDIDNIPCVGSGAYQVTALPNLSNTGESYVIVWDFPRHDKVYSAIFGVCPSSRVIFRTAFTFKLPCGQVSYALLNKFKLEACELDTLTGAAMSNQVILNHAIVTTFGQVRVPVSVVIQRDERGCYITRLTCSIPRAAGDEWYNTYIVPTKKAMKS